MLQFDLQFYEELTVAWVRTVIFISGAFFGRQVSLLTLKVLVMTIDAQWEGMGDVGSARYKPALLPPCPTIRVLSNSNYKIFRNSAL